jgi:hypothetical protein
MTLAGAWVRRIKKHKGAFHADISSSLSLGADSPPNDSVSGFEGTVAKT